MSRYTLTDDRTMTIDGMTAKLHELAPDVHQVIIDDKVRGLVSRQCENGKHPGEWHTIHHGLAPDGSAEVNDELGGCDLDHAVADFLLIYVCDTKLLEKIQ